MCLSIFQSPRCRINNLANFWSGSFHGWTRRYSTSSKLHDSKVQGIGGGNAKRWTRRPVTTKTEGSVKTARSSKSSSIRHEILDGTVSTSTTLNINKTEISQFQKIQHCDIQQEIAQNKELASLLTIIVFDIETTGFSRENESIIEIALQILRGGKNSTFQTLVNPDKYVANAHVHGITTNMELIPILLEYVRSHQIPGGHVLWIAHNARSFDVPFLIKEFNRCSIDIPSNWRFLDTLPLAREVMKSEGSKLSRISLQALREHYGIPLVGSAHRAMSDVNCLSLVLQRITFNLKLSVSNLFERSFSASDLINQKKKKSSG
ncbi:Exonuclease/helicase-like [Trema orientale]|uniref:Exonuclease/helicase-like n=1 Tax=Trema orientale TaxID=63057 RepID=A0A2P5EVG0_TREOI|nr:Exonuclease/helicase-like [Trema orientale]